MGIIFVLLLLLAFCILTRSTLAFHYASLGLELWFSRMIPSLLPFMILSGILIRLHLTEKASAFLYPVIYPLYRVRRNVCYCMLTGFLCGFPMGAKVTAELYEENLISRREASWLLAFCNNLGPVYFCSFVLPLLGRKLVLPYLSAMYGIPLLYGLLLRHTLFRDMEGDRHSIVNPPNVPLESRHSTDAHCAQKLSLKSVKLSVKQLLLAANEAVNSSMQSMLTLGGYMILFNLLNIIPHIFAGHSVPVLAPLFEITGGLMQLTDSLPLYSLLALSFGGLSCIAQTYSCLSGTDLSLCDYCIHKIILTLSAACFYLGWFLLAPDSFLR
jgi:hypothetical protein